MTTAVADNLPLVQQAIAFAARAHHGQMRKDNATPYVSHAFRVCTITATIFGIDNAQVLATAVLHDTLEDTTTDYDDLQETFGDSVARWVAALSKDGRLPYEQREHAYCETLAKAPWQVQVCKCADIYDNLMDMSYLARNKQLNAARKKKQYLVAIASDLKVEARAAYEKTLQLYERIEGDLL